MPYHHLAVAVRDMRATHDFYTRAMGFELRHVERAKTPDGGLANHYFYDTGDGELMAFWELHDPAIGQDFGTGLSESAGLPDWVNHIAFAARDVAHLVEIRERWRDLGLTVLDIDHHWCHSIYVKDPNGTMVEFSTTTAPFAEGSAERALRAIRGEQLDTDREPIARVMKARTPDQPLGFVQQPIRMHAAGHAPTVEAVAAKAR